MRLEDRSNQSERLISRLSDIRCESYLRKSGFSALQDDETEACSTVFHQGKPQVRIIAVRGHVDILVKSMIALIEI